MATREIPPADGWRRLAEKTRRAAVLTQSLAVEGVDGTSVVRPGQSAGTIVLLLMGVGCVAAAVVAFRLGIGYGALGLGIGGAAALLPGLAGLCLLALALYATLLRRRVGLDRDARAVFLTYGVWPDPWTTTAPRDALHLEIVRAHAAASRHERGHGFIALVHKDHPDAPVYLAHDSQLETVKKDARTLADALGLEVIDRTLRAAPNRSGFAEPANIETMPVDGIGRSHRDADLKILSETEATFGIPPTRARWIPPAVAAPFIGVAVLLGVLGVWLGVALLLPLGVGLAIATYALPFDDRAAIRIDPLRDEVAVTRGMRTRRFRRSSVAGVQLCFGMAPDWPDTGPPYDRYEINLVITDADTERISLACHPDGPAAREDAAKLADFLGVPFLDHSLEGSGA